MCIRDSMFTWQTAYIFSSYPKQECGKPLYQVARPPDYSNQFKSPASLKQLLIKNQNPLTRKSITEFKQNEIITRIRNGQI